MIRVVLPYHLSVLAGTTRQVEVRVDGPVTQGSVLDALESAYPVLRGTIRDPATRRRRPFIRFFALEEDLTHLAPDATLPDPVSSGTEPLYVVGAMAGG